MISKRSGDPGPKEEVPVHIAKAEIEIGYPDLTKVRSEDKEGVMVLVGCPGPSREEGVTMSYFETQYGDKWRRNGGKEPSGETVLFLFR